MVSSHAVKDFDIDIDEESDEVFLIITDGDDGKHKRRLGVFVRTEENDQQKSRMETMLKKADELRQYFMEHGCFPKPS